MKNKVSKELAAYFIAGVLTTLINFMVYYAMLFMGIDYKVSNTAAFIISVIFAFIVNKKYVFLSDKSYIKEFIKFSDRSVFCQRIYGKIVDKHTCNGEQLFNKQVLDV